MSHSDYVLAILARNDAAKANDAKAFRAAYQLTEKLANAKKPAESLAAKRVS